MQLANMQRRQQGLHHFWQRYKRESAMDWSLNLTGSKKKNAPSSVLCCRRGIVDALAGIAFLLALHRSQRYGGLGVVQETARNKDIASAMVPAALRIGLSTPCEAAGEGGLKRSDGRVLALFHSSVFQVGFFFLFCLSAHKDRAHTEKLAVTQCGRLMAVFTGHAVHHLEEVPSGA